MSDPQLTPPAVSTATIRRRPGGVVAAAVILGFVSLAMLFLAVGSVAAAFFIHHSPQAVASPNMPPGTVPPSQAAMQGVMFFFALIFGSIGVWGIATVVGLLKLKPWARVSIMIQGGLLAAIGLFGVVGGASVSLFAKTMQLPPNVSPEQLKIGVLFIVGFYAILALIGIWWLVYFAMRTAREAFAPPATHAVHGAALAQDVPPRRIRAGGPITDFTVAQPLPPAETAATDGNEPTRE